MIEEFKEATNDKIATVSIPENIVPTTAGVYVTKNSTTAGINCYNTFVVTQIKNRTGNIVISSGNYSYDTNTGRVWNTSTYIFSVGNLWNVTYTYNYGLEACAGVESTIDATNKVPAWLAIMVILAIVGILLAIVFKVLPTGRGEVTTGEGSGIGGLFKRGGGEVAEI